MLDRVRAGEEVVITERGAPVARLAPIYSASLIETLTDQGVLSRPVGGRAIARGAERVRPAGAVSRLVSDQRR
ncbi:type II toxin-antitoxin system Phd/YefM family antitoxin [Nakamurella sp.]|uniref:type II toxin-antitoxin system Phd/YefM family antitoxin n=1 Tax=Nakamurella sp. TaxID=1869182 RepID=UPI0037832C7F